MRSGAGGDRLAEDPDRLQIAGRGKLLEAERVEAVAGQQRQVGVFGGDDLRAAVVQLVALADGGDRLGVAHELRGVHAGATSANAAAAASNVKSMWSCVCARLGNQASNCDGGG